MEINIDEALRYLGVPETGSEIFRETAEDLAEQLLEKVKPHYIYRVFTLKKAEDGVILCEAGIKLTGRSAVKMLAQCDKAAVLACTLGAGFDTMLRREQVRDMSRAVILDACGSALVEAGCDEAEKEIQAVFSDRFMTDRFSPGYGDLPLDLQPGICEALNAYKRLGLSVSDSMLLNPVKSVTAVAGISDRPQMARIRGCDYCSMNKTCELRKRGKNCGI